MARAELRDFIGALSARPFWGLIGALLFVLIAAGVRALLTPTGIYVPEYTTYYPAIIAAALFAGTKAGFTALFLSCLASILIFSDPMIETTDHIAPAVAFAISGVLIIIVTSAYVRQVAANRVTAEQLRLAEQTARFGLWEFDPRSQKVTASENTQRMFGVSIEDRPISLREYIQRVHPDDAERMRCVAAEKPVHGQNFQVEYRLIGPGGERHILSRGSTISVRGKPKMIGAIFDVTEHKVDEKLLRSAIESLPWPVALVAEDGEILATSGAWNSTGGNDHGRDLGTWIETACPDNHQTIMALLLRALLHRDRAAQEITLQKPGGGRRFWSVQVTPLGVLPDGRRYATIAIRDITDERSREEQRSLVIGEFKHRLSNMSAVLTAIISQSLRNKPDDRRALVGRIETYMRTHQLLAAMPNEALSLRNLLTQELGALQLGNRIRTSGTDILLTPDLAIALAMTLHELMTNALKHGALKDDSGEIEISWLTSGGELEFNWIERTGSPVRAPDREGFGTKLFSRAFDAMGGHVTRSFPPTGFCCTIRVPIPGLAKALQTARHEAA
jgi:PAS domain S-box-containing protein